MIESLENYKKRLKVVRANITKSVAKGYDILLEYSESQQSFHFNYLGSGFTPFDEPSPHFMPIGYTNREKYLEFSKFVDKACTDNNTPKTIDNIIKLYDIFYG